jgi:exodeoxyribonuclease VII large subunit
MQVVARGSLKVYEPQGKYQLVVSTLEPVGVGAAELALQQLKEKLLKLGYFKPERKRPFPRFPKRIGLVTSTGGAALRDMLETCKKRWPAVDVVVRHCRVQGETAAAELADGVTLFSTLHANGALPLDAIVVARGGGSSEDLAAFNEEILAHAIYRSTVPVVSAVGHETDVSIADLVADARAITPTASMEMLLPDRIALVEETTETYRRLVSLMVSRIQYHQDQLAQIASRPVFRKPLDRVLQHMQRLDDWEDRLRRAFVVIVSKARDRVSAMATQLDSLSPLKTLSRGYSVTLKDGHVVKEATMLKPGDVLTTKLAQGEVVSVVKP